MNVVNAVAPNMPKDRTVAFTQDPGLFFKIDYNKRVLYIPSDRAMRMNHGLIDLTIDAVKAFEKNSMSPQAWDFIEYQDDQEGGAEEALCLLSQVPYEGLIACDIETRNTGWLDNGLLSVGFCWDGYGAVIISGESLQDPRVHREVQDIFNRGSLKWIWHNGKFDTGKLKWLCSLDARVDEDTMLLHYVGVNERRGTHGLKDLGAIFLQAPDWDSELDRIKKESCRRRGIKLSEFDYGDFPRATLNRYHAFDCVATYRLLHVLRKVARPEAEGIYRILIKASNSYRDVELAGIRLDQRYLEDLEYDLDEKIAEAQRHFAEAVTELWDPREYVKDTGSKSTPKFFNMKSPAQLKWLLTKVVGRQINSTAKEEIDELLEECGDDIPMLAALKQIRKYSKYLDTYVSGLRKVVTSDGRIHCSYNLHGTETGRLSSSEPNMQNIPRDKVIKNLFIAAPGKTLLQFDYSQVELRVLAYLSQDKFLKGVYQDGKDLHDAVATEMFGPDFTKEQRVQAKTINFGIAYGRGASNIAQVFKMKIFEAQKLIDNWFRQMPGVEKWIRDQRRLSVGSEPPTTIMGRERHFILTHENYNHVQNEGVNFPIQSIASDMTLCSLLAMHEWIRQEGLEDQVKIVATVHDSIILEADNDPGLVVYLAKEVKNIMEQTPCKYLPNLDFPFVADVEVGYKWGELSKL